MNRDDISDLKDTAAHAAKSAAETAKETGREALEATKSQVSKATASVGAALRDATETRAAEGKDMIAEQGDRLATGLRDAAAAQKSDSLQGRLLDTVADSVKDISEGLRGRSITGIVTEVEDFARRNPGAFVAGAALAGFAMTRFARASSRPEGDNDGGQTAGRRVGSTGRDDLYPTPFPDPGTMTADSAAQRTDTGSRESISASSTAGQKAAHQKPERRS